MKIAIDEVLAKSGKTRYWLSEEIQSTYPTIMKLCNNKTSSISFDLLGKICIALNCTPNDILDFRQ